MNLPQHLYVVSDRPSERPAGDDRYHTGPELEQLFARRLLFWRAALPVGPAGQRVPGRRLALYRVGDVRDWLVDHEKQRTKPAVRPR